MRVMRGSANALLLLASAAAFHSPANRSPNSRRSPSPHATATESFVYSPASRAGLEYAAVTQPFDADAAENEEATPAPKRWVFRLTGLVFALVKRSPLYGPLKESAISKMIASAEETGLDWVPAVIEVALHSFPLLLLRSPARTSRL